ncbi:MAG: Asp-tRNA(Asn)/Glu-tRNA(Gln) amidotransferase subunit GatC [Bacteroidetes bacterium]|nr:Asp-tRNA(Asn)/Glu-tRNA(Gln) amidotransferase subunit GatC [Bacteroidota bacterium]
MVITQKDVEYIAALANLQFSDSEKTEMVTDMNNILTYMEKLNELNTDQVEPLTAVTDAENVLRADQPHQMLTNEEALSNAPSKIGPFFRVPKVIDQL